LKVASYFDLFHVFVAMMFCDDDMFNVADKTSGVKKRRRALISDEGMLPCL
jgi:hypothetical protein